jgi:hypothetical protein
MNARLWVLILAAAIPILSPLPVRAEIQVASRSILSIYVFVPEGKKSDAPASALLRAADRALRERTSLYAIGVDELGIDRAVLDTCDPAVRFGCWVRAVRSASSAAEYLLVLTFHPELGIYSVLIDVGRAAPALELPQERAEAEIFSGIVETKRAPLNAGNEAALGEYFTRLFEVELRPMLERSGHYRAYGAISVRGSEKGAAIELDGAAIGVAEGAETLISGVSGGKHVLRVLEKGSLPFETGVQVERGKTAEVIFLRKTVPEDSWAPEALSIGGGVLAGAGLIVSAVGVVHAADGLRSACVVRDGAAGGCASLGAPSFNYEPGRAPELDRERIDSGGLRIAPFGVALLATGLVLGGGTWFFTDGEEINWWIVGASVLAGGATYAAGAVLGAR